MIKYTLAAGLVIAVVALMLVSATATNAYQPGCFGTPTPTTDPDSGSVYIPPACATYTHTPAPTNTLPPTRTLTPTPQDTPGLTVGGGGAGGDDAPGELIEGGRRDYKPEPKVYNYPVPIFPGLSTPTSIADAEGSATPDGEAFGAIDTANDLMATLEAFSYTPTPFTNIDGTPLDYDQTMQEFKLNIIDFFSYLKGLNPDNFGKIGRVISFVLLLFVFVMVVKLVKTLIIVSVRLFQWISKLVTKTIETVLKIFF